MFNLHQRIIITKWQIENSPQKLRLVYQIKRCKHLLTRLRIQYSLQALCPPQIFTKNKQVKNRSPSQPDVTQNRFQTLQVFLEHWTHQEMTLE